MISVVRYPACFPGSTKKTRWDCVRKLFGLCLLTLAVESFALPSPPPLYALVIGNAAYALHPLSNPGKDAMLIAGTLRELGFTVQQAKDLDRQQLFDVVRDFYTRLPPAAVSLVFYAGHGMQFGGSNYLLPVDVTPTSEQGIRMRAYPLANLLEAASRAASAVNLVVLDACRNNPFVTSPARTRSLKGLGLARVSSPRGTLIAYSTAPGQLAEDGVGRSNSLFAETLAAEMKKPGKSIEQMLKAVAERVRRQTFDDQQPWFETSLVDDFYFIPPQGVAMVTKVPARRGGALLAARGMEAGKSDIWYAQLSETEWTNLDWEIEQRVRRMTRDEIPLLELRANSGNLVAMTTLGIVWREGLNRVAGRGGGTAYRTGANNTKALQWLARAGKAGFPMAQVELGEMYYQGHGVDRSLQTSIYWLERAAIHRYPRARMDLAQVKAFSNPSPENLKQMLEDALKGSQGLGVSRMH